MWKDCISMLKTVQFPNSSKWERKKSVKLKTWTALWDSHFPFKRQSIYLLHGGNLTHIHFGQKDNQSDWKVPYLTHIKSVRHRFKVEWCCRDPLGVRHEAMCQTAHNQSAVKGAMQRLCQCICIPNNRIIQQVYWVILR